MNLKRKEIIIYIFTIAVVLVGDLVTKQLVSSSMQIGQSQTLLDGLLYFTYAQNEGMAWGMMAGKSWLFIIVAIIAAAVIIWYFTKTKKNEILTRFGLVLTLAGLVGNLYDRLILGYVRDFIDVVIFNYDFPIFNIADMGVVIGVCLIIVEIVFEERIHRGKH